MIRVAICDDDKQMQRDIKVRVERLCPESAIDCFGSGYELLETEEAFDLVFLDIGLQGISGIETAKRLQKHKNTILIFVTGLREYVFDAFDVHAYHYLLKPLEEQKFSRVFMEAEAEIREKKTELPLEIKMGGNKYIIPIEDICYCESCGRKIILYAKGRRLEFYGRLSDLEARLGKNFFRCHRGFLVHLKEVASYNNTEIVLKDGSTVYMAKIKYLDFVKAYMEFLQR